MFLCLMEPSVRISELNAPDSSDDHIFLTASISPFGMITLYTTPELPVPITLADVRFRTMSSMENSSFLYKVISQLSASISPLLAIRARTSM
uniref:Uncharacterized protein n=1 Tax=Rhizophora mucronata TaxID=61149 RepID=A0A2P2NSJ1_RHIMU